MAAINLSENTKHALFILFLGIILIFVVIGYLSYAVEATMKKQGRKADEMLATVVKAEYFQEEKRFRKFAFKKNIRIFYVQARTAFLIMLISAFAYLLFCLFFGKWGYNPLNREDGFGSLFYKFDNWPTESFFGIQLISGWPEVVERPHFEAIAIVSYIFVPVFFVGAIWFLICTQAFIARSIRIRKIYIAIYRKKLVPDEPTPIIPEE